MVSGARRGRRRRDDVDPALGLVLTAPPAIPASAWLRAGSAADRGVALIVQWMVGEIVLEDVAPQILLGPVGEGTHLPDPPALVAFELGRLSAGRTLFAAQPRDPGIDVAQAQLERRHLSVPTAVLRGPRLVRTPGVEHLERDAEAVLELLLSGQCLGEEDAGVDREGPEVRGDLAQHVKEDRLLLLKRAG